MQERTYWVRDCMRFSSYVCDWHIVEILLTKSSAFTSHSTDSILCSLPNHIASIVCQRMYSCGRAYARVCVCFRVLFMFSIFTIGSIYAVLYSFRKLSDSWRQYRIGCVCACKRTYTDRYSFIHASFHSLHHTILAYISKCICISFPKKKLLFIFPIVWHVPRFPANI